jgi:pimeloyl-ACP methyl ester carboxylesterase
VHLRLTALMVCAIGAAGALGMAEARPHKPTPAKRGRVQPKWRTLPAPPALPAAASDGTVEIEGAQIYYARYGKGDPVVLLHGGLGSSAHWGFQLPALVDRFEVITIDSRGQGKSTLGTAAVTYDQMALDVVAVLDKLGLKKASVVGWSDGGEVALKLGIASPDRVDRLFVFAANYDASGSKSRTGPSPTFTGYYLRCKKEYEQLSTDGVTYKALIEALRSLWHDSTGITKDQLRSIKAPVMMADGDRDEVIELDQIIEMSRLIPNAQLVVFKDASHFAMWQDPDAFNRAMVHFLTGDPAAGKNVGAAGSAPVPGTNASHAKLSGT